MDVLRNKRLLVLGGTIATYDVVKTAQKMGIYVIVADYLDTGVTKKIANETALISTNDIEGLAKFIRDKKIDGVFTGASEFNIRNMIRLCEYVNFPVYVSLEQWDLFSNKRKFKDTCRLYDVPVVPEYCAGTEENKKEISYPVIVKPVDSFSGHGISICESEEELCSAVTEAEKWSKSGNIIIEKYIQGSNVEVYYLVQDGQVMLLSASDRYTDKNQNGSPVPTAFYHPSKYLDKYLQEIDPKVRRMFTKLGVKNGVFFMESFIDEGKFMFYEMGYRLNATMEYHFVNHFNGFNPLEMMIRFALTGTMGENVEQINNPHFGGYGCEIALLLKTGTIHEIVGMKNIEQLPYVIHIIQFYDEGDCITKTGSLDQNFARIKVVADTRESLKEAVKEIYSRVSVLDINGSEMLIKGGN